MTLRLAIERLECNWDNYVRSILETLYIGLNK